MKTGNSNCALTLTSSRTTPAFAPGLVQDSYWGIARFPSVASNLRPEAQAQGVLVRLGGNKPRFRSIHKALHAPERFCSSTVQGRIAEPKLANRTVRLVITASAIRNVTIRCGKDFDIPSRHIKPLARQAAPARILSSLCTPSNGYLML